MTRANWTIDDDVAQQVRIYCVRNQTQPGQVATKALVAYLAALKREDDDTVVFEQRVTEPPTEEVPLLDAVATDKPKATMPVTVTQRIDNRPVQTFSKDQQSGGRRHNR